MTSLRWVGEYRDAGEDDDDTSPSSGGSVVETVARQVVIPHLL